MFLLSAGSVKSIVVVISLTNFFSAHITQIKFLTDILGIIIVAR